MGTACQYEPGKIFTGRTWMENPHHTEWPRYTMKIFGEKGVRITEAKIHFIVKTSERKKGELQPRWSKPIPWSGKAEGPEEVDTEEFVKYELVNGVAGQSQKKSLRWSHLGSPYDIVNYQIELRKRKGKTKK